jgi:proteasome lid subunit RPN8/RPN11
MGIAQEAGLQLFGHAADGLIEILRVDRPSLGDRERLHFDFDQVDEDLVGDLHSHPTGSCLPSARDLSAWSRLRRSLHLSAYVGIIAVPLADGWQMMPYVVRFRSADRDVAERCVRL